MVVLCVDLAGNNTSRRVSTVTSSQLRVVIVMFMGRLRDAEFSVQHLRLAFFGNELLEVRPHAEYHAGRTFLVTIHQR